MNALHWGFIGHAKDAQRFIEETKHAQYPHALSALLHIDDEDEGKTISNVDVFRDIYQFLQSGIEAVYIASPFAMHYAQARQCLINGKAVLCERPVAKTADELRYLIELSELNQVFLMEGMWIRFMPAIKKLLALIKSHAIGEIVSVKAKLHYPSHNDNQNTGGALYESGIFPVFIATLFLGKPDFIRAQTTAADAGKLDAFSAFMSYESGQYSHIETTPGSDKASNLHIEGERGAINIKALWNHKPEGIELDFGDGHVQIHKSDWDGDGLYFELDEVYQSLQDEAIESSFYTHQFSLDVMETLDAIRKQLV